MPTDTYDQVLNVMTKVNNIFLIVNKKIDMDKITIFINKVNDLVKKQSVLNEHLERISSLLEKVVKCCDDLKFNSSFPQRSIGRSSMSMFLGTTTNDNGELRRSMSISSTSSSAKEQKRHTLGAISQFQMQERSNSSFM